MPLSKGVRLGPYEIVSPLGAGGMGEVYRGRDTRLDRSVAIKVVLQEQGLSAEARQRFEREAKAISALQHPHICALHDVGSHDGVDFLVMELVDGETLASRLERGPLSLAEALRFGAQMADALAGAHRQGIVHRDLKPANVMLTPRGVKLLDFGLARREAAGLAKGDFSLAPTRKAPLTEAGTILGTLHYMSPEQLEGRAVDGRSDVFSLGVVLYEMVTGVRAFDGTSPVSLISSILRDHPPPVSERAPVAPPALDRVVEACLAKDPEHRWQSARDVALVLEALATRGGGAATEDGAFSAATPWLSRRLPWGVAALATALALVLAVALGRREAAAPPAAQRLELPAPPGGRFNDSVESATLALSPDGQSLAFVAQASDGAPPMVWLRPLSEREARPLAGTEGAFSLFWSPDGRSIAFFTGGKLKRLDVEGGPPVVLSDVPTGYGMSGTWGKTSIVFGTIHGGSIFRVPLAGGPPSVILTSAGPPKEGRFAWPWFLADGERFLYLVSVLGGGFDLRIAEADGGSRTVGRVASRVELAGDMAVFVRDGALVAERLDVERGELVGGAVALAPLVRTFGSTGSADFTASQATVVVAPRSEAGRLTWFDRQGRPLGTVGGTAPSSGLAISPDGRRAINERVRPELGTYDLWMIDLARGVETRLTSAPGTEVYPYWLSGGAEIVYSASNGESSPRIYRRDLATGAERPLVPVGGFQIAIGVTPAGDLLFRERTIGGGFELRSLPLAGGEPRPFPGVQSSLWSTSLSPDGTLLTYVTAESGRPEAYLRPVAGGESVRASIDGAHFTRFARDGRSLFFTTLDRRALLEASITFDPTHGLHVGAPVERFALPPLGWTTFDIAPDGRFLAVVRQVDASRAPLEVITGWRP